MDREYWVVTDEGVEVNGPYHSSQAAYDARDEYQDEWSRPLIVINSNEID